MDAPRFRIDDLTHEYDNHNGKHSSFMELPAMKILETEIVDFAGWNSTFVKS